MDYVIDYQYDWLDVFPEAKQLIKSKINKLTEIEHDLSTKFSQLLIEFTREENTVKRIKLKVLMYDCKQTQNKCSRIIHYLKSQLPARSNSTRVTEAQIQQALQHQLESLVGETKRVGVDKLVATCPFHDDEKPSLQISTTKNLYYCFVCNCGGSPITYIMKTQNLSFRDAVLKLI
jgi:hypothetical protein